MNDPAAPPAADPQPGPPPPPPAGPSLPAAPPAAPARPVPRAASLLGVTAIVATVGVVVALLGIALSTRTVHSPIQDCGSAARFLLDGRSDVFADPGDPDDGFTRAQAEAGNARGCRARVADAIRVPAYLATGGLGLAVVAGITEAVARSWGRHRRRRATA